MDKTLYGHDELLSNGMVAGRVTESARIPGVPQSRRFTHSRILLGILLLTASVLKAGQVSFNFETSDLSSCFKTLVVGVEFIIGCWLVSGWQAVQAWYCTLAIFSCFSLYSFILVLRHTASCGCFGPIELNPRIALLIDLVAIGALLRWPPMKSRVPHSATITSDQIYPEGRRLYHRLIPVLWIGFAIVIGLAVAKAANLAGVGTHFSDRTSFEPKEWIGIKLPLLEQVDIGEQLSRGLWIVLLYHQGCSACEDAIDRLDLMADELAASGARIALIETEPTALSRDDSDNIPFSAGRLDQDSSNSKWFVPTPLLLKLQEGVLIERLEI